MAAEENPLKQQKKVTQILTFQEKVNKIRQNITVEPILMCYVVPNILVRLTIQTLYLDKACRVYFNYGDTVCDALVSKVTDKYQAEEVAVQELVAEYEGWKNILLSAIPSLLILFLGAWSDRTGKRKICILVPIVGELLMCLSNILNVYFFYELPLQVTMFFEAFLPAITGGWIATYMGAFSYIGDISSEGSRTFRLGIANLCLTAGSPIGSALSGILLNAVGYYGVFTVCFFLYLFSIVYGIYYVKDPERPAKENSDTEEKTSVVQFLKYFFDMKHVKDTLSVAFKKGPNCRRRKSILVLASIAFIYGPAYGEYTVKYLFTRYRFNWDALQFSFYKTYYICVHALGAVISISWFSRRLHWDDSVLGIVSTVSKLVGSLAMGLSKTGRDFYIAISIEMFNASSFTALRSISSKLVASDELGKMVSVFNLMEIITSMVFGPIYSWVYMATLELDAGIFYYVSTGVSVPPILIFIWFYIQHRRKIRRRKLEVIRSENELKVNLEIDNYTCK